MSNNIPNFIIIGAQKCGTTSLYHYITQHPQVKPATKKEVRFFDNNFAKGVDWYLDYFPNLVEEQNLITGEATPYYIEHPDVPQRLFNLFPKTKIIVILRNPIDRTISQYHMNFRNASNALPLEKTVSKDFLQLEVNKKDSVRKAKHFSIQKNYLLRSIYVEQLKNWLNFFPKEQFLILKSEDFFYEPACILKQVFDFLGLPDYKLTNYKNYNPGSYAPINDSIRSMLAEFFRPYNQKLEELLEMKFNWDYSSPEVDCNSTKVDKNQKMTYLFLSPSPERRENSFPLAPPDGFPPLLGGDRGGLSTEGGARGAGGGSRRSEPSPSLTTQDPRSQSILIIAGMHRSGTSLTASLLQSSGLYIGQRFSLPQEGNIKGDFENLDFVEFHQAVLRSQGCNEHGCTLQEKIEIQESYLEEAKEIINCNASSPAWGWKDPRTTLFLNFWKQLLPDAKFLLIYRSPWEVVDSLLRRGDDFCKYQPGFAVKMWSHYNRKLLDFYKNFAEDCILASASKIVTYPDLFIKEINSKFNSQLENPDLTLYVPSLLHTYQIDIHSYSLLGLDFSKAIEIYKELNARAWQPKLQLNSLSTQVSLSTLKKLTSSDGFEVSFQQKLINQFPQAVERIALLVTPEYSGICKNGGIGTYYHNLSEKLAAEGWYVILLLSQSERNYQGDSDIPALKHIFSLGEVEQVLELMPAHLAILAKIEESTWFEYESFAALFFVRAIETAFPNAQLYVEFPDWYGLGYRTIQAKRAKALGRNCLTAVTLHGASEWLAEANEKYIVENYHWWRQVGDYEQYTFEKADLAMYPSDFLKAKVESYGWKTSHAVHLPYCLPIVAEFLVKKEQISHHHPECIPLVFFGRLEERKGLRTFIEALELLPPAVANQIHIIFMGKIIKLQSSELKHLDSQQYIAQELGSNVSYEILSNLFSQEAIQLVSEQHHPIVCLASPQENFPHSALEMGQLPVSLVVADTGGFRETLNLIDRESGVLYFIPGDSHSLAQAITQALAVYPETPSIPERAFLEQVNRRLLKQRLDYMSQAYPRSQVEPTLVPSFPG